MNIEGRIAMDLVPSGSVHIYDSTTVLRCVDELDNRGWTSEMNPNNDFDTLKKNIASMLIRMKAEVDYERKMRRIAEDKVKHLENELTSKNDKTVELMRELGRLTDNLNYMKRKMKSLEMENADLLNTVKQEGREKAVDSRDSDGKHEGLKLNPDLFHCKTILPPGIKGTTKALERKIDVCFRQIFNLQKNNKMLKRQLMQYQHSSCQCGKRNNKMKLIAEELSPSFSDAAHNKLV